MIKFKVKRLTPTAKLPKQENLGDLFDLFADDFCLQHIKDLNKDFGTITLQRYPANTKQGVKLNPQGRILIKTGIAIELPIKYKMSPVCNEWRFDTPNDQIVSFAVADIRPRSGLALKHGITVLNTPGTIDNSYRKEIGIILYNAGHDVYTISKGDKIAQMLIRELAPAGFGEVEEFTGEDVRGGFGSTGR